MGKFQLGSRLSLSLCLFSLALYLLLRQIALFMSYNIEASHLKARKALRRRHRLPAIKLMFETLPLQIICFNINQYKVFAFLVLIFSAKLPCTIVMRLNSIQWPINGSMDRSSYGSIYRVNNPGGAFKLFLLRFLELRDVRPTNRS
jgi:hypothetical protein